MKQRKASDIVLLICRILFGGTFVFSSFVKAVDPLGTAYKIGDYLDAFGISFGGVETFALCSAFALIMIEFLIGFNLLLGIGLKPTKWLAALFMLVMTPLTLYLAIANPVSDCGCFGDAVVLTNWQTFYKNLILDAILILIFAFSGRHHEWLQPLPAFVLSLLGMAAIFGVEMSCYRHLPWIDFRPYKVGNNIAELMEIPEGAPMDEYEISFVYEKDGEQREFSLSDYPAGDSSWVFVEQKSTLIKQGYVPPIHDFTLQIPGTGDITDLLLENEGYTLLVVSTKLEKADEGCQKRINQIAADCIERGIPVYGMTASPEAEAEYFKLRHGAPYPIGQTDEITLKTIVRSNPGLVLIKGATVMAKWHYNDLPTDEEFGEEISK